MFLRLPLPLALRLKTLFENEVGSTQDFFSETIGEPWPAPNAPLHVRVTASAVSVWWGQGEEEHAVVRLRAFDRRELGL